MWHRIFDCQEGSREIDRDGLRPFGKREFFNRSPHAIDASIGKYNVDPPPAVKHLLYCPLHLIFLSDIDRKSTRLNSSHSQISYAVFCLKKKKITKISRMRRDE